MLPGRIGILLLVFALALTACTSQTTNNPPGGGGTGGSGAGGVAGTGGAAGANTGGAAGAATGGSGGLATGGAAGQGGGTGGAPSKPVKVGDSSISMPRCLAVTSNYAFVAGERSFGTTGNILTRIPLAGGAAEDWNDPTAEFFEVAADDKQVYAADFQGLSVHSGDTAATVNLLPQAIAPRKPYLVALTPTHVYFDDEQNSDPTDILRMSRASKTVEVIATGVPTAWQMAVDGGQVFLGGYNSSTLHVLDAAPSTPTASPVEKALAPHGGGVRALALDTTRVFLATWSGSCQTSLPPSSQIFRALRTDPSALQSVAGPLTYHVNGLAVTATHLYYAKANDCGQPASGEIWRIALDAAGGAELVIAKQEAPVDMVAHGGSIYWLNAGTSTTAASVWRYDP